MAIGFNTFLNSLNVKDEETSQKELAEEAIKKQLFKNLCESKLQKGESKDLARVVEQIANDLGLQDNKTQIAQYIKKLFEGSQYQYEIDDDGNIRANYSRLYMLQKENDKKGHEEAQAILKGFIQKVEEHVFEMEQKKVIITDVSIMHRFSEEELQENGEWIDLAIDHVLEMRNQER